MVSQAPPYIGYSIMLWQLLANVGTTSYRIHVIEEPLEETAVLEDENPAVQRLQPLLFAVVPVSNRSKCSCHDNYS